MVHQIARLEYNAAKELLTGQIPPHSFFTYVAYSGGSRGHQAKVDASTADKYLHAQTNTLSSRLATTPTLEKAGKYTQRGGTLPPGHYTCQYHAHYGNFGECIQLHRTPDAVAIHSPFASFPIPHGRTDGFFIHGSGPKGSDGCIIPAHNAQRLSLNKAIKDFPGKVILFVTHVSYMLPAELWPRGGGQLA
jgi:hypothetical protein